MCLDYYLDSMMLITPYLTEVRAELSEIYKKYETKFGSMRVRGLLNQSQLVRRSIHGVRYLLMMMVGLVT